MFIKELQLNVSYAKEQAESLAQDDIKKMKDVVNFTTQLAAGIAYYRSISHQIEGRVQFNRHLDLLESEIEIISRNLCVLNESFAPAS